MGNVAWKKQLLPRQHRTPPNRSIEWRRQDGRVFKVTSIDDVIAWSKTSRGGKQLALNFDEVVNYDKLPMNEHSRSCPSSLGMCE